MTLSPDNDKKFLNYPEPREGPDVPLKKDRKSNPALSGILLLISAILLEWFGPLRRFIWQNTGFANLRIIRRHLEDYEPRFDPTVIPETYNPRGDNANRQPSYTDAKPSLKSFRSKYYTSADYQALYTSGELTPTAVAKAILSLIRRDISPKGEHSIAWHDCRADLVIAAAKASTLRYKNNCTLGPLDGIPTGIKDDFDMEGYRTTLGSLNDYTNKAIGDQPITSWCVKKLEDAGAIILGRLAMNEFGMDTSGNNPNYGTPLNPYNPQYYTGGSSSGSAYAVSTGLIPFALGGDGGGSIRIPASFCSIYGLKPTHGRISQVPSANHSNTCAVNGPLASDIRTLAAMYHIIGTPHPSSHFSPLSPPTLSVSPPISQQPRILGVPEEWMSWSTPKTQELCQLLLDRLITAYNYKLIPIKVPFLIEGQLAHAMTVLTDAATLLPDTTNITAPNKILVALGSVTPSTDYLLAQKLRQLLMQHLSYLWKQYPGMIIVTPTTSCEGWPIRSPTELKYGLSDGNQTLKTMEYVWMANFTGVPALVLPVGFAAAESATEENVPVGVMGMGEWGGEDGLLQWGVDAEALTGELLRRPPIWVDVVEKAKREFMGSTDWDIQEEEVLVDI